MRFLYAPALILLLCSTAGAAGYDNYQDPMRQRIREEVIPAFEQGGLEGGRRELEAFYGREMATAGRNEKSRANEIYANLWIQAQLHTPQPAWSNAIYEFILDASLGGDTSGKTHPYSGMGLIHTLAHNAIEEGRLQKSRELVELGKRISFYHLRDARLESYPVTGNLLPQFPDLPSRQYAIASTYHSRRQNRTFSQPLDYYPFYLHETLMDVAFQRGNWEEAAQYADWLQQFGRQFWEPLESEPPLNKLRHGKAVYATGTRMLAEILWLHGYTGASADLLEDLVEHYPVEVYRTWNHDHMRELSALRMNGNTTHGLERWLLANEVYLQSGKYGGIPDGPIRHQVYRLFKEGDSDQALVMLDRMQADAPHFRQCAIELYESGVFTHPDLESLLMEQLEYKRSRGLKIDEPRLYQLYASLLADQGRWEEALRAQRECIRLYEALRIPNRSLAEHATYLTYLYAAGLDELLAAETEVLRKKKSRHSQPIPEWIESRIGVAMALQGPPPTQTLSVPPADLQPTRMQTVTLPGLTVRTRFSLSNPAQVAQTGVLTLNPPATLTEVDESTLQLSWLTPDQAQSTHTITLPPFSEKRLYLLAPLNGDQEGEITLRWQGDRQPNPSVSRWVFSQGERESSIALTNSSRIRQNPFYLVPLYQSLVRAHEEGTERVAFRIVCSHPTRVEVYRETDQRLLYVDNNGDGDLLGSGDVLFGDHENANRPQIEFADGEDLAGLLIYLLPDEGLNQPVEIEVSLWQENQWVPQTVHVWEP